MSAPLDIFAIFDHAPGSIDIDTVTDPAADCNRPAIDPANWIELVHCHSELDTYRLAMAKQTTTVTHAALATKTTAVSGTAFATLNVVGDLRTTSITLVTHGLGYVPKYMIAWQGARLPAGTLIQHYASSPIAGSRVVQHFASDTIIGLVELAASGSADLPATTQTYEVMIFDSPAPDPGLPLKSWDEATGVYQVAHGKLRSDRAYLRNVLPAESGFDLNLGVTMDPYNGGVRVVTGGNVIDDDNYALNPNPVTFTGPAFVAVGGV